MNENATSSIRLDLNGIPRCSWVGNDEKYQQYHDEEWGKPLHGDRELFEKICLEGFQAGLSWSTILHRRENFRRAFHSFDIAAVAAMNTEDVENLLQDASIIRHRGKIKATITNAQATQALIEEKAGALDALVWSYAPKIHPPRPQDLSEIPSTTSESLALSTRLRSLGFRFVGATTLYALMQSAGLVDDHVQGCHLAGTIHR